MLDHVVHFITPDWSEPFQLGFFAIILCAALLTIIGVWRTARQANWEANWEGTGRGTAGLALDVDHGSFNDVCDAVATKPEKYAEIVPGLLLIFGLLGTFVGLGIALDSASSILTNANAQNALDGGMNDLLEMMGGLGTKFKTSTWGILGFLLVKLALASMGRDTNRQQWVIARMKQEMDRARQIGKQQEEQRNQRMQAALVDLAVHIDDSLEQRLQQDRGLRLQHHEDMATAMQQALLALGQTYGQQLSAALEHDRTLRLQANSASVLQLGAQLTGALEDLRRQLGQGNDIALNTQQILQTFTASQEVFSDSIKRSADTMSEAASNMNGAADEMSAVITSFDIGVRETLGTIEGNLGTTIGSMDRSLRDNLGTMATLLDGTASTLQKSLDTFSTNTGDTLKQVTTSMAAASESQNKVMGDVRNAMGDVQEMVQDTTNSIAAISTTLSDSLRSVAKSNLQMAALVDPVKDSQANMSRVVASLQQLVLRLDRDGSEGEQLREEVARGSDAVVRAHKDSQDLLQRQTHSLEALRGLMQGIVRPLPKDEAELAG